MRLSDTCVIKYGRYYKRGSGRDDEKMKRKNAACRGCPTGIVENRPSDSNTLQFPAGRSELPPKQHIYRYTPDDHPRRNARITTFLRCILARLPATHDGTCLRCRLRIVRHNLHVSIFYRRDTPPGGHRCGNPPSPSWFVRCCRFRKRAAALTQHNLQIESPVRHYPSPHFLSQELLYLYNSRMRCGYFFLDSSEVDELYSAKVTLMMMCTHAVTARWRFGTLAPGLARFFINHSMLALWRAPRVDG